MYVLGTAGHVDHGKSALVRALTGIDPDRLPEEKRRQMTIDLGFAWFKLPDGREVSIVDVPGHEDFIRNMLAGVWGIDLVLLIIAADEGVMPQTKEHLDILNLLRVKRGIVVITKKDLVDEEGLELAKMEAEEAIKDTSLSPAPMVAVSALTGEGLSDLTAAISRLLDVTPERKDMGRPRLPIDRIFTIRGFGTVVTGTLIDGKLQVGQEIEIVPPGLKATIRRLETHKQKRDTALPGSRVSANLAGIPPEKLLRGMVITTPEWLKPSEFLDVKLRAVKDLPHEIAHNMTVMFYSGTSEVSTRVRLLDKEKLGANEAGWAQLRLEREVALTKGDLFVLRSPQGTLGGGEIVDTEPRRHRRFQASVIENLEAREKGAPEAVLLAVLESGGPAELGRLIQGSHLGETEVKEALKKLIEQKQAVAIGSSGPHQLFLSLSRWENLIKEAKSLLQNYHTQFPLRQGMSREELKSRIKMPPAHFDNILRRLAEEKVLMEEGKVVRLPTHSIRLSSEQEYQVANFMRALSQELFSPPSDLSLDPELLSMLLQDGRVVKVAEGFMLTNFAYEEALKRIIREIKSRGKISVAEVRDLLATNRKNAVALMEYLDEKKMTLRVGGERVLRQ